MNQLAQALGSKFAEHKDNIRIRTFELGGHTFKVKVPLTAEYEVMQQKLAVVDESLIDKYYDELSRELLANKDKAENSGLIEYTETDIKIDGKSLRDAAKNKAMTESRITALFKLLIPEEKDFDMETITYDMIEELFPFAIQVQVIEEIAKAISPDYVATRGK